MIKIYMYTNTKDNNKKYIGQTSSATLEERAGSNFVNYKESWRFYDAIKTFGPESFTKEIILETEDPDEADDIETNLISKYKTQDPEFGYNIQPGGKNFVMNEDIKKKIGEKVKSSKKFLKNNFESHAKKVIALEIQNKSFKVFDSLTDAANALNISRGNIGCMCNGKGRAISLKGFIFMFEKDFSAEKIDDYIKNFNDRKSLQYGEERNKKMGDTLRKKYKNNEINFNHIEKKVRCLDTNEVFNSIKEAGEKTGTCYQNISQVCNGRRKTANGLRWEFISSTTSQR